MGAGALGARGVESSGKPTAARGRGLQRATVRGLALAAVLLGSASNGAAGLLFFEDFSDSLAGWTLGETWEVGPAAVSSGQQAGTGPDPGTDHTPTADNGVAGVVIGGNAPTNLHDFYYLTSPTVNTAGQGAVTLDYYRWLNSDYSPYMKNRIEVFDGSLWTTIWETGGFPAILDTEWTLQSFDVSSWANPAFQFRIGYSIESAGVYTVASWNVDDVSITGTVPEPSSLGLLGLGLAGLAARRRTRPGRRSLDSR